MEIPHELLPRIATCLGGAPVARLSELCHAWQNALLAAAEHALAAREAAVATGGGLWGFIVLQESLVAILETLPLMNVSGASTGIAAKVDAENSDTILCGQVLVRRGASVAQCGESSACTSHSNDYGGSLPSWLRSAADLPQGELRQWAPLGEEVIDASAFLRAVRERCAGGGAIGGRSGAGDGLSLLLLARLCTHTSGLRFLHSHAEALWIGSDGSARRAAEHVWSVLFHLLERNKAKPVVVIAVVEYTVTAADYPSSAYHTPGFGIDARVDRDQCLTM